MQTTIHKENYDSYVEHKPILHNQGVLLKEIEALKGKEKPPRSDGESSSDSQKSDKTISYSKWSCNEVNWSAFSEISSQPSTSNVDKGKQTEDDDDEESDYQEGEDEENEDSDAST